MSFRILYTRTAVKDIRKLDNVVKKKLKQKLEDYSKNPLAYARRLIDPNVGTYRWRIGNYRVVFDIHGKTIVILRIGHRREIYR